MKNKRKKQSGQVMFFVIGILSLGLLALSTGILVGIIQHNLSLAYQQSNQGRILAEAGADEAILQLLRDPEYDGGQVEINGRNVIIEVSGDNPKTITSSVNYFGKEKEIEVEVIFGSGASQITSWQEN